MNGDEERRAGRSEDMATLVVHTGGIGDFILCCPSIQAMGREDDIELLGNTERLELAVAGGLATASHAL